ncbi:MAG: fibronectin type III domain-containing protein [Candidatus Angelobacter sp.]
MKTILTALALALTLGAWPLTQIDGHGGSQAAPGANAPASQPRSVQEMPTPAQMPLPAPVSPIGTTNAVQITNGPVVENVTDTTAEIAWSTNVNSGTGLRYGTDPSHLDQTAGMPWGGLTHRVSIKNLQPNTTYYFRAESGQGQGTGSQAQTAQASFQTKPAGPQESRK